MKKRMETKKVVGIGLFTAIVVILQMLGSFIHFGTFSVSLVLLPIVLGAALYGSPAGLWLGFVFGAVVLLSGDASPFLAVNPLGTVFTVLIKGMLAGLAAALLYRVFAKKNETLAVVLAALLSPLVNTGVFLLCCKFFFMPVMTMWASEMGFGENVAGYMILGLVGANFLFEVLFNVILSPVILRLLRIGRSK